MKNIRAEIMQILINNLKISESGFSGELQVSGIFKSAEEIEKLINKDK